MTHDCAAARVSSNNIYLLVYSDPTQPLASCQLDLQEDTRLPSAPTNLATSWERDGSQERLTLSWSPPADGRAYEYTVLAVKDDGQGADISPKQLSPRYSMCLPDERLFRRSLVAADYSLVAGVGADLRATDPLAVMPESLSPRGWSSILEVQLELFASSGYRLAVVASDAFGNSSWSELHAVPPAPAPRQRRRYRRLQRGRPGRRSPARAAGRAGGAGAARRSPPPRLELVAKPTARPNRIVGAALRCSRTEAYAARRCSRRLTPGRSRRF